MQLSTTRQEDWLKTVFDDYYHRLCFYATKFLRDPEEAKDVVQELFVGLWERKPEFVNQYALSAFLYSSIYHACINRLTLTGIHHKHHDRILQDTDIAERDNYVTGRVEHEVLWEIFQAIDTLPAECRKVFKLSYIEGYDLQKVADELDITVHTVKSQRARGKKLLQERLKNLFPLAVWLFFS